MLEIHLYGKFRELCEKSGPTDESVMSIKYKREETISGLLDRLDISPDNIGEIFLNYNPVELDEKIPDDSRIAIFPLGMHLLCGGQHMKGHGFIVSKKNKKMDYWNK
ncbi:MAG: hypothetical protein GF329_18810 [Candidatus Lokiarchaeota archaeon]|nr:hypothetical protein [Candidatus Lokiarchaeota archaeon]